MAIDFHHEHSVKKSGHHRDARFQVQYVANLRVFGAYRLNESDGGRGHQEGVGDVEAERDCLGT